MTRQRHGQAQARWASRIPQALAGAAAAALGWSAAGGIGRAGVGALAALAAAGLVEHIRLRRGSRRLHAQLEHGRTQLRTDPATGLPNQTGFAAALAATQAGGRPACVITLRPTRTHLLDTLTPDDMHAAVRELANRLATQAPADAVIARVADATIAILCPGDLAAATILARALMLAAEEPIRVLSRWLQLPLAAGIATVATTPSGRTGPLPTPHPIDNPLHHASIALGTVTTAPGAIAVFTPQMLHEYTQALAVRDAVVHTLRTATPSDIQVLFEPVIEVATGRLIGVAARAGWQHDDHTTLSAGQLTSLARDAGLASRVDSLVIRTAVEHFATWRSRHPDRCRHLWVTVCAQTLADDDRTFPQRLRRTLTTAGVPATALVIDPLDEQPADTTTAVLRRLQTIGVQVATSHALILGDPAEPTDPTATPFEADVFDISPVLVDHCVADTRARHLVAATVDHAAARSATTTARQVTTIDQHEQLRLLQVATARGPLYAPPVPAEAMTDLLAADAAGTWSTPVSGDLQHRASLRAWQDLRQVIRDLPIATFACDRDGLLVLAEGALLAQLDLPGRPLDQPLADLIGDPNPHTGNRPLAQPLQQALRGRINVTTIPAAGHWLQIHLCPQRAADRTITGAIGVALDVTHRIQAEHALRNSEQRFREVFANAPVGMAIVDPDTTIVQTNPALATMLGYTPADLIGRPVASFWHEDSPTDTAHQYDNLRNGTIRSYHAECACRHRDGSPVWTRITIGTLADATTPGTVLGIIEDLRDVKRLEVELRHAQKLEAVGMLAAGIAHEINTPIQFIGDNINFLADAFGQLTTILTATHRLVPTDDSPQAAELMAVTDAADLPWLLEEVPNAARQSLEGVGRVAQIVAAMRNFGHPDGRDPTPIDINTAIRDTAAIARNEHKYVADLILDLGDVPHVLGYPSEFHQVVLNLIVNAAHAIADAVAGSSRRGTITVHSWAEPAHACVSVADDGCGMTPEVRQRIFDPFYTTKEVGRGTGQGLTIVHGVVVDKHRGSIDVDSTPGAGTTFTIRLPLPTAE